MTQTNNKRQDFNPYTASRTQFIEEFNELRDMVAKLETRCCNAEEKAAELGSELSLIYSWQDNPNTQVYAKAVLIGTYRAIQEAKAHGADEKNGKVQIWQKRAAHLGGVSVSTISDYWAVLKDSGLLEIEYDNKSEKRGDIQRIVYVRLTEQAILNAGGFTVSTEKKKKQGGKRIPRCPHCQSLDILKETKYTCRNCSVTGMTKKQLDYVTEELIASEIEMDAQLQQDLQAIAESQAQQPTVEAPEEPTAALQAFTEEIRAIDTTAAAEPPDRDCFECTYRYGAPVRHWVWDLRKGNWACAKADEHHLPKVEF